MAEGEEKVDVPAQEQEEKKQQEPKNGCTKDAAPVPQEISPLESKVIRQVEVRMQARISLCNLQATLKCHGFSSAVLFW